MDPHPLILCSQRVTIKDAGSLHGTHVNKEMIGKKERRHVRTGDTLTFGTTVDRGVAQYHPYEVDTDLTFGTEAYVPYRILCIY